MNKIKENIINTKLARAKTSTINKGIVTDRKVHKSDYLHYLKINHTPQARD